MLIAETSNIFQLAKALQISPKQIIESVDVDAIVFSPFHLPIVIAREFSVNFSFRFFITEYFAELPDGKITVDCGIFRHRGNNQQRYLSFNYIFAC